MKKSKNKRVQLKAARGLHDHELRRSAGGMLWLTCSKKGRHADCKELTVVIGVKNTLEVTVSSKLQGLQA